MSAADPSDQELIERTKAGEKAAFGMLIERYQRRAFAVAFGMLHSRDDALDVVQDAFIKVHHHVGSFQGSSSFYTWLYRIVANLCIDQKRRQSRRPTAVLEEGYNPEPVHAVGIDVAPHRNDGNPVDNLLRRELGGTIDRALGTLSDNHRLILLLREVDGLSYEELAQVLGINKGTVMSRLFHARKNMQAALTPYLNQAEVAALTRHDHDDTTAAAGAPSSGATTVGGDPGGEP